MSQRKNENQGYAKTLLYPRSTSYNFYILPFSLTILNVGAIIEKLEKVIGVLDGKM